jgi:hypothetical protein
MLVMLFGGLAQAAGPEVTIDFTSQGNWNIPTSWTDAAEASFTDGTYTIKAGSTEETVTVSSTVTTAGTASGGLGGRGGMGRGGQRPNGQKGQRPDGQKGQKPDGQQGQQDQQPDKTTESTEE